MYQDNTVVCKLQITRQIWPNDFVLRMKQLKNGILMFEFELIEEKKKVFFRKIVAILIFLAYICNGAIYPYYENFPEPLNFLSSLLSLQFSFLAACLIPAIMILKKNEIYAEFKIRKLDKFKSLKICILALFIFPFILITAIISSEIAKKFNLDVDDKFTTFLRTQKEFAMTILIFGGIFLAPVVEELVFRLCLFNYFRGILKRFNILFPVILTSAIFALLHGDIIRAPALFLLGIVLQYIFFRYKTILAPILFHSMHNVLAFVSFYFFS
ncbi:MAG TPA: CPBP family intramembrane metalloprotease [Victivallales bacterium]|nr:CPBP family intramembrane metalloprotease [Victivallales bacterium]HRR06681.1 CPBP family intramembrane metalloprotease [Victivallales bacterium]HRR28252.1 CPBP family intramembrane metalloprotease [Victivallales bacterium]HRU00124.1 CPBP family intramembrane metalloprotease [Victivallales bacterium]